MGCFDVVCALTNTPIKTGEQCVLCVFPKKEDFEYGVTWVANGESRWGAALTVFHGEYDDYGSIDVTGKLTKEMGAILENFREDGSLSFFVCKAAWDWAQERYKSFTPNHVKERRAMRELAKEAAKIDKKKGVKAKTTSTLMELAGDEDRDQGQIEIGRLMMAFCRACKHPLSGLGCYHQYSGEELEPLRELQKLIDKRLTFLEAEKARLDEEFADG